MHHAGGTRGLVARDQAQPLEWLPEFAPRRRDLAGRHGAIGVGADGEERGISEIEEAGEADDDIEAEGKNDEGAGVGCGVDVAFVLEDPWKGDRGDPDRAESETAAQGFRQAPDRGGQRLAERANRGESLIHRRLLKTSAGPSARTGRPGGTRAPE